MKLSRSAGLYRCFDTARVSMLLAAAAVMLALAPGCAESPPASQPPAKPPEPAATAPDVQPPAVEAPAAEKAPGKPDEKPAAATAESANVSPWQPLSDGKTLANWKSTAFGGEGKVHVKDGAIVLEMAPADLTGITWAGQREELPDMDYEIALEVMRVDGGDFFCGLTFPVRASHCSLIVGGWGGSLVGLSSFDGMDASENETSVSMDFENNRWYDIRIRVTPKKIEAWIDNKQVIDAEPGERKVDVRLEVEGSCPLGVAAWHTKSAVKNIRIRRVLD